MPGVRDGCSNLGRGGHLSTRFCLWAFAAQDRGEILQSLSGQATRLAQWSVSARQPFCFGTVMLRNVSFGVRHRMPVRSGESG
jgi:hypothetical protein